MIGYTVSENENVSDTAGEVPVVPYPRMTKTHDTGYLDFNLLAHEGE